MGVDPSGENAVFELLATISDFVHLEAVKASGGTQAEIDFARAQLIMGMASVGSGRMTMRGADPYYKYFTPTQYSRFVGDLGEDTLFRQLGGGANLVKQQPFLEVNIGRKEVTRYADVFDTKTGISFESKVGRVSNNRRVRQQIAADRELIESGRIDGASWNFYPSPHTGKVGPTPKVEQSLKDAGIEVKIHDKLPVPVA